MQGATSTLRERGRGAAEDLASEPLGLLAGVAVLAVCVGADIALDHEAAAIVGTYVAAPFITALLAGPAATAAVGVLAVIAAVASGGWNMNTGDADQLVRIGVIAAGTLFAVAGSWYRARSRGRAERMALLDAVGAVADGSLPLGETLQRVTEVIAPGFADICMVDAVHEGKVTRIATRAGGRPDAEEIEKRIRHRPPTLPDWLVNVDRAWREIPRWWPRMHDEELRRMAHSPDDLEFLRSLGIRSSIVTPIRARNRNLGTLTVIAAWSGDSYGSDDVRFAQILAGRIGLALDNAGLFSDLESIERRMDTVMSILDEAVVIHGTDGELVFANPAAAQTLGYETSEEAISTPAARIPERYAIRDEAGNEVGAEALAGRQARSEAPAAPRTLRIIDRASGRERWMRTKAQGIKGTSGEILYTVTAIEDVTDVKRAEFTQRLLGRTGELLSDADDYRRTLERVPQLLVPEFADCCSIEMPRDDGRLERVALSHCDPERLLRLRQVRERFPISADADTPLGHALRHGEAQLVTIDDRRLRDVSTDPEHLEALREMRIGSVIVAPMLVGGETVAALTLINHEGSRIFDSDDLATSVEVARRAALAIENARIADERVRVADALQRELLPPSLPRMPGWEVATMYEPAGEINEVGGDFYEVFPVEEGWAVVLGDVSGKGAAAAALTAEARHTIRTAGSLSGDPRRGLYLLDENLRGREDAALCSIALLILPGPGSKSSEVSVYLAGHPHPLLLREGSAEAVGEPGPLLGVVDDPAWLPAKVTIEPGDQLVLYTDGVIEARGADGERFGTDRLRRGLAGCESPELAVDRVRTALASFGARAREDDAALVAIRRGMPPAPRLRAEPRRRVEAASQRS
jgi:PAS domain S-box-containing protein